MQKYEELLQGETEMQSGKKTLGMEAPEIT